MNTEAHYFSLGRKNSLESKGDTTNVKFEKREEFQVSMTKSKHKKKQIRLTNQNKSEEGTAQTKKEALFYLV